MRGKVVTYNIYNKVTPEVRRGVKEALSRVKSGYTLDKISRYTNHPEDDYLYLVIGVCRVRGDYGVWLYNSESGGLVQGRYDLSYKGAYIEYAKSITDIYN